MFEHFIIAKSEDKANYERVLAVLERSKQDLMDIGYDEIVIEDFYDIFVE